MQPTERNQFGLVTNARACQHERLCSARCCILGAKPEHRIIIIIVVVVVIVGWLSFGDRAKWMNE